MSQVSREKAAEILSQLSPEAASNIVIKIEKPLDALEIMRKMELAVAEKVVTTLINSVTVEDIKKFTTKRTLPSGRVVDNTTMVIENLKKDEAGGLLSKMDVTRAATIITVLPEATAADWGVSMLAQNPDGATASMVAIVEAGGKRNAAAMLASLPTGYGSPLAASLITTNPDAARDIMMDIRNPQDTFRILSNVDPKVAVPAITEVVKAVSVEQIEGFTKKLTVPDGIDFDPVKDGLEKIPTEQAKTLLTNMEPEKAAVVLAAISEDMALEVGPPVLEKMETGKAAVVLATVSQDTAVKLGSTLLKAKPDQRDPLLAAIEAAGAMDKAAAIQGMVSKPAITKVSGTSTRFPLFSGTCTTGLTVRLLVDSKKTAKALKCKANGTWSQNVPGNVEPGDHIPSALRMARMRMARTW